jgi:Flp pilus assembly CpaF family ATPase
MYGYFLKNVDGKMLAEDKDWKILELESGEKIFCLKAKELNEKQKQIIENVSKMFDRREKHLSDCLKEYCEVMEENLEPKEFNEILEELRRELIGYGVFEYFFNAPLEEIALIGLKKEVYVFFIGYGWLKTNLVFEDSEKIKEIVNKFARDIGRRLSLKTPRINASLPDGSRLHAAMPPVATDFSLTIRKFKENPMTILDLIRNGMLNSREAALLWLGMLVDANLLIVGNTGSGKTTLLNALLQFLGEERIIVVEETPEIKLLQEHKIKLLVSEEQEISMESLIIDSLRMRPDRVVVGEIRNLVETKAYLQTILAGQGKGSYATFHAQSLEECLQRLKNYGLDKNDLNALDLIIVARRIVDLSSGKRNEKRKILGIYENCNGKFEKINGKFLGKVKEKILNAFGFDEKQLKKEIKLREKYLEKLKNEAVNYEEFYNKASKYF